MAEQGLRKSGVGGAGSGSKLLLGSTPASARLRARLLRSREGKEGGLGEGWGPEDRGKDSPSIISRAKESPSIISRAKESPSISKANDCPSSISRKLFLECSEEGAGGERVRASGGAVATNEAQLLQEVQVRGVHVGGGVFCLCI